MEADALLLSITLVLMLLSLIVSIIPMLPGPALMWLISFGYAYLTDFERVPIFVFIPITLLMILGSTTDAWLRYFGMSSEGGSCLGVIGSLVGSIAGSVLIPIPIVGTLVGAILGALLVEALRVREIRHTLRTGRNILEMYAVGIVVEISISFAIFSVFTISIWLTA